MRTLTKGQNSLTEVLGRELNEPQPPWETIQGQTKEFVKHANEMANHAPPKGTKESWAELTSAFSTDAAELDKAAQAKDKTAALAAHTDIKNSCMACHRQHRMMGPGMGGPRGGGPGGRQGFGPPGGGPPGGPLGGPPGPPPGGAP
jgi:hypothetical protein